MTEAISAQEANKKVVGRYIEAFSRGDMEELRQIFAPDALVYGVPGWGGLIR